MKRVITLISIFCLFLIGCTQNEKQQSTTTKETTKQVTVTTSFLEDMVKQIAGDTVTIETIIPAGEDPHLYVAKASDLKKLKETDLVLYHGLHFEGKMVEALEQLGKAVTDNFPKERLISLDEDGQTVTDPHFWFDITLYKLAVENVSNQLQNLLPDNKDKIKENTTAYLKELDNLDDYIKTEIAKIPEESRYLITPHDAFNYFGKNYNIKVHAPQGISTDSEVDNNAMIETVNLIVEKNIKAIFSESTTNPERMKKLKEAVIARGGNVTVVTGKNQELYSDSLAPAEDNGREHTFIRMYRHNVDLIVSYLR